MGYCDYTDQWLKDLTRQRRAERKAALARGPTVRFSVLTDAMELVEFKAPLGPPLPASGGRRSGAYKSWKHLQWHNGNRTCHYCGCALSQVKNLHNTMTLDHKDPLGIGGADDPSNWCMCCWDCNMLKGMMTEAEFRALMASVDASLMTQHQFVSLMETGELPSEGEVTQPSPVQQEDAEHDDHDDGDDRLHGCGHGDVGGHQIPDRPDDPQHDDELNDVHAPLTAKAG